MTENDSSTANNAQQSVKGTRAINSTRRAKAHRERKTSNNLKRWEFYAPEILQTKVHEFAKAQGLSVGAAAEVLLTLGFQSFYATSSASGADELDGVKTTLMQDVLNINQHSSAPSPPDITIGTPSSPDPTHQAPSKAENNAACSTPNQTVAESEPPEPSNALVDDSNLTLSSILGTGASQTVLNRLKPHNRSS